MIGALWNVKERRTAGRRRCRERREADSVPHGVTLRIRDDSSNNSLVVETPGGQRVTLQDGPASVRIEDGNGNAVTLAATGVTVNASAKVTINASNVDVNASLVTVDAGMSRFSGVVQCDTLISTSVVSASYSPGAGNQM